MTQIGKNSNINEPALIDQPRAPRTYKLTPDQLTTQVLTLTPSELRAMKKSIEEELGKREVELEEKLKEVRGEK